MLKYFIKKLSNKINLTQQESFDAMSIIMEGNATPTQIGGFLVALNIKGETIDEITGAAKAMREKSQKIHPEVDYFIDICGTGGDGINTFNISTAVAFVSAAGGVVVAKHGNRAMSSKSGAIDVLEALGINVLIPHEKIKECIEKVGLGFMFAQKHHPSVKHVAEPRKELGIRTIFNILGPLTNPAGAKGQVLGVFDKKLVDTVANVLLNLGTERALVVHGEDGMDEITTTDTTMVAEIIDGKIFNYKINPVELGFKKASKSDLLGGNAIDNAKIIESIFSGEYSFRTDIVVLNAATTLYVGKKVDSIEKGINIAKDIIKQGLAMKKLNELREFTNS